LSSGGASLPEIFRFRHAPNSSLDSLINDSLINDSLINDSLINDY
jgi:hypothetical protein